MRPFPKPAATEETGPGVADYVVTALSPMLIMGVVGSLVFFLAEIFYAGKYESNLLYTLFFFVFGIVLVCRISIVVDPARSTMYGLALSGASLVALIAYVKYPPDTLAGKLSILINCGLLLIVWWTSHKLVRDCTHIDERRESADRGLLSAVGFEGKKLHEEEEEPVEPEPGHDNPYKPPLSWWERYQEYRKRKESKPHTPGTTIIYFAMAALPIFGLGQSLIPPGEGARRSFVFQLAAVYVACSLGLLLTTSFLGVRRYIRQRDLTMPKAMTGIWLGIGAALIAGFIVVSAILPRPYSETPLVKLDFLNSTERNASKNAVRRSGDAGKGEGRTGEQTKAGDGSATAKKGNPGGKGEKGESKEGSGDREGKSGNSRGDQNKGNQNQSDDSKDQKNGPNAAKKGEQGQPNPGEKGQQTRNEQKGSKDQNSNEQQKTTQNRDSNQDRDRDSFEQFQQSQLGKVFQNIAAFLKWIVFAVVLLIVLFIIAYFVLKNIAPFTKWAQSLLARIQGFLDRLFGRRAAKSIEKERPVEEPKITFAQFSNPFEDGSARSRSTETLIRYTFSAMEAWASDREAARSVDETPLEFAGRIQNQFPDLDPQALRLAVLIARLEYAQGNLPTNSKDALKNIWAQMVS